MRLVLLSLILLLTACSQFTKLDGTFYSDKQDCVRFNDDEGLLESKTHIPMRGLKLKQTRTKLKFSHATLSLGRILFRKHVYKYHFKLLSKTDDEFKVSPISRLAKEYFDNRIILTFKTKYKFADPTNYFTKIYFYRSRCLGLCNELHLELDYSGNLKVTDNGNGVTDTAKTTITLEKFPLKI